MRDVTKRQLLPSRQFTLPKEAYDCLEGILIPPKELRARIREMSLDIMRDYADKDLYALAILKGAIPFFTDLLFNSEMILQFDYGCRESSSYHGTQSGDLQMGQFNVEEVSGKDVLIVEDILDTGKTLLGHLAALGDKPRSVKIAVLLEKRLLDKQGNLIQKPVAADYVGFTIPNLFVVGYGLDYNNKYRYLQSIGVLKKEYYS
ncbi:MAG: hypoxanthine phosphoribosyltransferase [Thaumarchaeota archaeon]|nr:hypoxanthine phosphoribosyltransferase [Nitrososphaerota archaeon]